MFQLSSFYCRVLGFWGFGTLNPVVRVGGLGIHPGNVQAFKPLG